MEAPARTATTKVKIMQTFCKSYRVMYTKYIFFYILNPKQKKKPKTKLIRTETEQTEKNTERKSHINRRKRQNIKLFLSLCGYNNSFATPTWRANI